MRTLALSDLKSGIWSLTQHFGGTLGEACSVCLEDQGHTNGAEMNVDGDYSEVYELHFIDVDEGMKKCYADIEDATELGACAIAILLIRDLTPYTSCERSRKGTGFDYWVGDGSGLLFNKKARLEVSGIRSGSATDIRSRVNQKLRQTDRSDGSLLPAVIVVVEFSAPRSQVEKK